MLFKSFDLQFFAHKKGQGSSSNGRDSRGQRLGLKLSDGQIAKAGSIIVRQRGTSYHPGLNVGLGKDYTLFALKHGVVRFKSKGTRKYVFIEEAPSAV